MGNSQTKTQFKGRKKQVHWKAAALSIAELVENYPQETQVLGYIPKHPGPPGKPELVATLDSTPDVVTIKWDKPKSDGGSPVTGYLVEHRRTGSPHWVRATPLLIPLPELTLSGLEPGWRYQFRVSAQNAVGMSTPGEISEPLTVTLQRSIITAPKFTEELQDTSALENELKEFIVHVIGQPPPKICWFKDGFEVFSSRRTRIINDNGKSVLTIHQVALSDEGEIKCTATNRAGHASTKGFVKIDAPPKIRLPRQYEDGLLFELDEVIRLKVSIAGRPQPLVFWSHNGETIPTDERYEITDTDKSSTLRINEAKRDDRGEYQIRAVNKIGEDITSFLVTVTDRPKPPENVRVIMALGKSVTLSWDEPQDDGGCRIGAYIVEYFRVGWNVWLKAATCRHLTTMLNDLIEGSEYKFRIKAESPYGVSDPSDETDVIFIPDPKRGIMSAPTRSRSQQDVKDDTPVAPKRRSTSSTRKDEKPSGIFIPSTVPTRPKRERIKSPPKTPDRSPPPARKEMGINTNMFDRASITRELSYGFDVKARKIENKLDVKEVKRSPSPKSPSKLNTILSNIIPGKKSPSPNKKSPSPKLPEKNVKETIAKTPNLDIPVTVQNLEAPSERSDLFDRSPSPMERRLSLIANGSPDKKSSDKSPSPNSARRGSLRRGSLRRTPSPTKLSPKENGSRRGSLRSDRQDSIEERGSSEFMLVLLPEQADTYYQDQEDGVLMDMEEEDEEFIPPPMSLSAPELGAEPPTFEPIRTSVSSSELLYERSLQRFRQAAEEEEAERAKRDEEKMQEKIKIMEENGERRMSVPKIQINNKDQEELSEKIEKKPSFNRRFSAGPTNVTQQYVWAKRRQSLKSQAEADEKSRSNLEHSKQFPIQDNIKGQFSPEKSPEIISEETKISHEKESLILQEESREKTKLSPDKSPKISPEKSSKIISKLSPEKSKISPKISPELSPDKTYKLSPEKAPKRSPKISPEKSKISPKISPELSPDKTYKIPPEQAPKASPEKIKLTPESSPKLSPKISPEKSLNEKRKEMLLRQRSDSEEMEEAEFAKVRAKMEVNKKEMKNGNKEIQLITQESWEESSEESEDERLNYDTVPPMIEIQEEETYHPRMMNISAGKLIKNEEPFEILTTPAPVPDPNFIPKPILKKSDEPKKIPDKPIRKTLEPENEPSNKESPQSSPQFSPREVSPVRSRTPSPSPGRTVHRLTPIPTATAAETQIQQSAADAAKNKRNLMQLQRKNSEEEESVVIDHYGSIVKQYGTRPYGAPQQYPVQMDRQHLSTMDVLDKYAKYSTYEDVPDDPVTEILSHYHEPTVHYEEKPTSYQKTLQSREPMQHFPQTPEQKTIEKPNKSSRFQERYQEPSRLEALQNRYQENRNQEQIRAQEKMKQIEQARVEEQNRVKEETLKDQIRAQVQIKPEDTLDTEEKAFLEDIMARYKNTIQDEYQKTVSPVTTRRPTEVSTPQKRKTSRTRSTSRTRTRRPATPSDAEQSPSPRPLTPEQEQKLIEAEEKVRSSIDYLTDLTMFFVACYLYLFTNPLWAVPVLIVTVYRQIKDEVSKRVPNWMKKKS